MKAITKFFLLAAFVVTTLFANITGVAQAADYTPSTGTNPPVVEMINSPTTSDESAVQNASNWEKIYEKGDVSVYTNGSLYVVFIGNQMYVFSNKHDAMKFARAAGKAIPAG